MSFAHDGGMKLLLVVLPALVSLASAPAFLAPARVPQEPGLADLAWLAGTWEVEAGGTRTEEAWLAPGGGLMLGMNREVRANGKASFEYLRIEQRKEGLVYVASPGGRGTTDFTLADLGDGFVEFENLANDFPQHIRYEQKPTGELHARVWSGEGDAAKALQWTWKRAAAK